MTRSNDESKILLDPAALPLDVWNLVLKKLSPTEFRMARTVSRLWRDTVDDPQYEAQHWRRFYATHFPEHFASLVAVPASWKIAFLQRAQQEYGEMDDETRQLFFACKEADEVALMEFYGQSKLMTVDINRKIPFYYLARLGQQALLQRYYQHFNMGYRKGRSRVDSHLVFALSTYQPASTIIGLLQESEMPVDEAIYGDLTTLDIAIQLGQFDTIKALSDFGASFQRVLLESKEYITRFNITPLMAKHLVIIKLSKCPDTEAKHQLVSVIENRAARHTLIPHEQEITGMRLRYIASAAAFHGLLGPQYCLADIINYHEELDALSEADKVLFDLLLIQIHEKFIFQVTDLIYHTVVTAMNEKQHALALQVIRLFPGIDAINLYRLMQEACKYECTEVIRYLNANGFDMNHEIEYTYHEHNGGYTWKMPLLSYCIVKHADISAMCLMNEPNANITMTDQCARTPLHYACMEGSLFIARELITRGADITATDSKGRTPLTFLTKSQQAFVLRTNIEEDQPWQCRLS